jgi:tetratricopeptide (TPR) repeat protein
MADPIDPRKKLEAELKRLRAKRKEESDRDLRAALDLAISAREQELESLGGPAEDQAGAQEAVLVELPEAPTPEALAQAEKLLQQARLEARREHTTRAAELLDEAVRIAPGSSSVQEMVGDGFLEQKQTQEALARYDLARRIDPKNLSADRKHAELVYRTKARAATAELSLEFERDQMASNAQRAAFFSLFLPGSGQIVLGERFYGGGLLAAWTFCVFWVLLWKDDVAGLLGAIGIHVGKHEAPHPNYGVLLPILAALFIHVISVFSAAAEGNRAQKPAVAHPEPPVNLPFE